MSANHLPPSSPEKYHRILNDLYSQPGVSGVCLQSKQTVLVHDLPYSESLAAEMIGEVERLIQGYEAVSREIWQICLGFQNIWLLVVTNMPLRLTILVVPGSDCELIASRGMRLLLQADGSLTPREPAQVVVPTEALDGTALSRKELERVLTGLLGRVSGIPQATKIVQKVFNIRHTSATSFTIEEAGELGGMVLEHVPNRGKRSSLHSEFLNTIKP